MRICDCVAAQLRSPHGRFAPVAAAMMNVGNRPLILASIDSLGVSAGEHVIEVGFGGGLSLGVLVERVGPGRVAAVDLSREMVERAERHHEHHVVAGRLTLACASAETMPFGDAEFDAALAVQNVYFWPDTEAGFRELHRVLKPHGRLAIGILSEHMQDKFGWDKRPGHNKITEAELVAALHGGGFVHRSTTGVSTPRGDALGVVVTATRAEGATATTVAMAEGAEGG